jgi:hypothetical protein
MIYTFPMWLITVFSIIALVIIAFGNPWLGGVIVVASLADGVLIWRSGRKAPPVP